MVLLVLPLFHIYGLNTGLGMVAATAATGVLAERFDPAGTASVVRAEGVTNIPGAPPMYVAWAGADAYDELRGVRMLASGASSLPPAVLEQVQTAVGITIREGYGLTETAPVRHQHAGLARSSRPGRSAGRSPASRCGWSTRAAPTSSTTTPARSGSAARTCSRATGRTAAAARTPDGWWATGDVAYADEDGDLFLVDRRKELVIVSGFNVYPREVEDALAEHPDVAEVAVIAVPHPYTGEAVKAFVVPREGAALQPEDVTAHAATRLARFKRPTDRRPSWRRCRTRPPARSPRASCARGEQR